MKKIKHAIHNKKGFTLLFAVLVSTLVVSIGATIISIALRQTILSGTSRESQFAFYAANTALDCAHYWDTIGAPGTNNSSFVFPAPIAGEIQTDAVDITCSGINIKTGRDSKDPGIIVTKPWEETLSPSENKTTFFLKITDKAKITGLPSYEYCAEATVKKVIIIGPSSNMIIETTIESKGYNTCDENNPRRVERGLIQQYQS